jgi:DNA-binding transcriptional regulator YiaG
VHSGVQAAAVSPAPLAIVKAIVTATAKEFGVGGVALTSDRRGTVLSMGRWVMILLCREMTNLSYPGIALQFGRDHSTIMRWEQLARSALESDEVMRDRVERIRKALRQATPKGWAWRAASVQMVRSLLARREELKISQDVLAGKLAISLRTFSRYENQETDPPLGTLCAWVGVLGLRLDMLPQETPAQ